LIFTKRPTFEVMFIAMVVLFVTVHCFGNVSDNALLTA